MSIKHLIALSAIAALSACGGNSGSETKIAEVGDSPAAKPQAAVKSSTNADAIDNTATNADAAIDEPGLAYQSQAGTGLSACPPSEVLTDISAYAADHTAPNANYLAWHAENGKRAGVVTTATGLQYQAAKKGASSGPSPAPTDVVRVNYHGFLLDGTTFDSSYERGQDIEFPLNRVIKGWTEGLGLMKPCDAWTFYIPGELAYGQRGAPQAGIGPNATLGFHVQLIEIK